MNTDKTILHLRPHHFLCIPNYRGHGYSSRFDEKMKAVIAQLQGGSGAEVRITQGVDDLCGACPHCTGSCCDSEMPALFDSRFLALTGLAAGDSVIWNSPEMHPGSLIILWERKLLRVQEILWKQKALWRRAVL